MLQVYKQSFDSRNDCDWLSDNREDPVVLIDLVSGQGFKKVINIGLVLSCLLCGQVWAKPSEIISGDFWHVALSLPTVISKSIQHHKQRVGNGVELFSSIPLFGKPMPDSGAQSESANRPNERKEWGIGVEQQDKLSPEDSHKFWRLLLIQLAVFAAALLAGIYFSLRASMRREWRKHIPKGRLPKAPVLAMVLILCLPRRIKSRRWQVWEQRQWFRDVKVSHGFEAAYRDSRCWKKLFATRVDA